MMLVEMPPLPRVRGKRTDDRDRDREGKKPRKRKKLTPIQKDDDTDGSFGIRRDEPTCALPSVRKCGSGRRLKQKNDGRNATIDLNSSCKSDMFKSCVTPPTSSFALPPLKKTITGGI